MREYKFRGLSINGEWHYGLLSHSTGERGHTVAKGWYISNKAGMPWAYQVRPETIGQYTGKRDSEGVDIYEGDIIDATKKDFGTLRSEVKWDDEEHQFFPLYRVDIDKVVGNIHEHFNLLKKHLH